jgi:hypothetical protein
MSGLTHLNFILIKKLIFQTKKYYGKSLALFLVCYLKCNGREEKDTSL